MTTEEIVADHERRIRWLEKFAWILLGTSALQVGAALLNRFGGSP